jgi:hypothetical protein
MQVDDGMPSWIRKAEEIDWPQFDYAYQEAPDINKMLQTAAFGGEDAAHKACRELHAELEHQSTIYNSTYEAIPFLFEVLKARRGNTGLQLSVLRLIGDVTWSTADLIENNPSAAWQSGAGWPGIGQCHGRLWLGTDEITWLLANHADMDVRMLAAYILGLLIVPGKEFAPAEMNVMTVRFQH